MELVYGLLRGTAGLSKGLALCIVHLQRKGTSLFHGTEYGSRIQRSFLFCLAVSFLVSRDSPSTPESEDVKILSFPARFAWCDKSRGMSDHNRDAKGTFLPVL